MIAKHYAYPPHLQTHIIERTLNSALDFLQQSQLSHGEFITQAAENATMTKACVFDSSPFTTAFVLYSIDKFRDTRIRIDGSKRFEVLARGDGRQGIVAVLVLRGMLHIVSSPLT